MFHLTCYEHGKLKAVSLATHWAQHPMKSLCFPWEHWLLSADDTIPQQGIVWLLTAKPDIYLLSAMQVYGNVYVSGGQRSGEQAGSIKSVLENRPGHVEKAASPWENEEQMFAVHGCLSWGGIEGDLTSERGLPSQGDLRCSPSIVTVGALIIQLFSCLLFSEPVWAEPRHIRERVRDESASDSKPLEFSASRSGLSYPFSLRMLPCWDHRRSPGMCEISS